MARKKNRRRAKSAPDAATLGRNAASLAVLRKRYRAFKHPKISETEYIARNMAGLLGTTKTLRQNPIYYELLARRRSPPGGKWLTFTGRAFKERARPQLFLSEAAALERGRELQKQFFQLRRFTLVALPLVRRQA